MTALKGFHDGPKLAHLDVRRENVCVDIDLGHLYILVDLDRSCNVSFPANMAQSKYAGDKKYAMYTPLGEHWLSENLDWLQLGLMLGKLFLSHANDRFVWHVKNGEYNYNDCTHIEKCTHRKLCIHSLSTLFSL